MENMISTKDLWGMDEREILVWHHRLNHCSFKSLIRLPKKGIIPRKIIRVRKIPYFLPDYLGTPTICHGVPKANTQVGQSELPWRPDPGP